MKRLFANFAGTMAIRTDTTDHIEIWRVPSCDRVCLLNVKYDTSATTDAGGTVAYTSNHRQNGIRAYETSNGQEIWSRRDLGDRQIRLSKTFPLLYAFSRKSCDVLNCETGKSKRILHGVHELWESPYENIEFVEKKERFYLLRDGKAKWSLERERFATLDAVFSKELVFVTESDGDLRCCAISDGSVLWRFSPPGQYHCLSLAYVESEDSLVALTWNPSSGGPYTLVKLTISSGFAEAIAEIDNAADFVFCNSGANLLLHDGRLLGTLDGALIARISEEVG